MPEISVVIPVYNAEKYLPACLDSVLAQTLRNFEIVCIDDGSTDGSLAILNEYATRDARLRVVSCEHANAGHCRNVGIAESHGAYLLFLDADDVFSPEMFETLLNAALKTNAEVAICGHGDFRDGSDFRQCLTSDEKPNCTVYREPAKNTDIFQWIGWPWDKLIARRLIDRYSLSFQEQRTTNDLRFIYAALTVAETIVECPVPLVAHRRQIAESLSATRNKSPRCFYDALVGYYDTMCALNVFPGNDRLLKNFYAYSCRESFWQLDTLSGADAADTIFPLLKDLCNRWNWCAVMNEDGHDPLLGRRCAALMEADDIIDFERRFCRFLLGCHDELVAIKRSHTYRFAQGLAKLSRLARGGILRTMLSLIPLVLITSCDQVPEQPIYIAHAGGEIDGHRYTNSREAVCHALACGITHIELDLQMTSDGHLVAVHDWKDFRQMCGLPVAPQPLSLAAFKASSPFGKYTPLTAEDIASLMDTHPEMHLVTDKTSSPQILEQFFFKHRARTIVECFSLEDYRALEKSGFTCYYSSCPKSKWRVFKKKIGNVLRQRNEFIPTRYVFWRFKPTNKKSVLTDYRDGYGESFAVFTVKDKTCADRLASSDRRIRYVYIDRVE